MRATPLIRLLFILLISTGVTASGFAVAAKPEQTGAKIKHVGVFRIGGDEVQVTGAGVNAAFTDTIIARQLLVNYFIPDSEPVKPPIVMMPPWGFPADAYLSTLDGREGWALNFLRAGHPVYLVDPANTMRAGFNPEPFNRAQPGEKAETARFFSWGKEHVWTRFGLGPEYGVPFDDGRFPVEYYDQFVASFVHISVQQTHGENMIKHTLESNVKGVIALLNKIGPAVLFVNSGSGPTGFAVAQGLPTMVKAVINFEPLGCPVKDFAGLVSVPVLSLFADHMEVRPQMSIRKAECQLLVDSLLKQGGNARMIDLPELGIRGNSHMAASENNSADIAQLMIEWLARISHHPPTATAQWHGLTGFPSVGALDIE